MSWVVKAGDVYMKDPERIVEGEFWTSCQSWAQQFGDKRRARMAIREARRLLIPHDPDMRLVRITRRKP